MESSSTTSDSAYRTVWSAPPKRPSGRTKFRETRHPVYRGVRRRGDTGRWVCEVREPNKKNRIWLGTYPTAEMAARAHDVAAITLRGRSACLNFADSAWLMNIPPSLSSVQEIKRAAMEAAEAFKPKEVSDTTTEDANSCSLLSTSSSGPANEREAEWPLLSDITSDLDRFEMDSVMFDLGRNGDMDIGLYYASLAEGLLMEPPFREFGDWENDEFGAEISLWN